MRSGGHGHLPVRAPRLWSGLRGRGRTRGPDSGLEAGEASWEKGPERGGFG